MPRVSVQTVWRSDILNFKRLKRLIGARIDEVQTLTKSVYSHESGSRQALHHALHQTLLTHWSFTRIGSIRTRRPHHSRLFHPHHPPLHQSLVA